MTQFEQAVPGEVVDTAVGDIDAAREVGGRLFYPQELTSLDRAPVVSMSVRAGRIGPFVLGELSYSSTVRIDCGDLSTSYHVNVPLSGRIATSHRGQEAVATPDCAAVYGPVGRTVLSRWEAGARQLCVKIDKRALESTLAERIGRELTRPVRLAPTLDLRSGAGRSWSGLARMVSEGLHTPGQPPSPAPRGGAAAREPARRAAVRGPARVQRQPRRCHSELRVSRRAGGGRLPP
ncbi:MAG: hypothetical protein L0I76_19840 [Pseudonocardia sp.]|nr:hypothetical protein [Pseudonocardia sp.]